MSTLAIKRAQFLSSDFNSKRDETETKQSKEEECLEINIIETERQKKRQRANRNKSLRQEEKAEKMQKIAQVDCIEDSESDDEDWLRGLHSDAAEERCSPRESRGDGATASCTDACCAGLDEFG